MTAVRGSRTSVAVLRRLGHDRCVGERRQCRRHAGHYREHDVDRGQDLYAQGLHPRHQRRDPNDSRRARRSWATSTRSDRRCSFFAARRSTQSGQRPIRSCSRHRAQPGQRQPGDWGGLILIGNATINRSGTVSVEGSATDGDAVVSGKNYEATTAVAPPTTITAAR